jgi:hypothetical protein
MPTPSSPERTAFSLDVLGRYVCNRLDEAKHSGVAVAAHLFNADTAHRHRIPVLEGGLFVLTEHVQDLPMIGLNVPGATTIAALRSAGQDQKPREQVWGLAWHSSAAFPGLAYCLGGRSTGAGGRHNCWTPRCARAVPRVRCGRKLWWMT